MKDHDAGTAKERERPFARAGEAFEHLCEIMATLRAPDGCAWDRAQTLQSLKMYLLEEVHETLDALDRGDVAAHREELGDLLLQIVFQSELRRETSEFEISDVVGAIKEKLIRRHPHVFAGGTAKNAEEALASWESIKAQERPRGRGRLAGLPPTLPALLLAYRCGEKAASLGCDWSSVDGAKAKVEEELLELLEAIGTKNSRAMQSELGDVLFSIASVARHLGIDPEDALRGSVRKFRERFERIEEQLLAAQTAGDRLSSDALDALWNEAKKGGA